MICRRGSSSSPQSFGDHGCKTSARGRATSELRIVSARSRARRGHSTWGVVPQVRRGPSSPIPPEQEPAMGRPMMSRGSQRTGRQSSTWRGGVGTGSGAMARDVTGRGDTDDGAARSASGRHLQPNLFSSECLVDRREQPRAPVRHLNQDCARGLGGPQILGTVVVVADEYDRKGQGRRIPQQRSMAGARNPRTDQDAAPAGGIEDAKKSGRGGKCLNSHPAGMGEFANRIAIDPVVIYHEHCESGHHAMYLAGPR